MLNYFGHGGCICDEGLSSNNAHVLEISADVKEAQLVLKLIRIHAAPPPPSPPGWLTTVTAQAQLHALRHNVMINS